MHDETKTGAKGRKRFRYDFTYSIWWNLMLILLGSAVLSLGLKCIATPHTFLPGGLFGLGSLLYYSTGTLTPGWWYLLFNVPVFLFAWFKVSRRFVYYSLLATLAAVAAYELIPPFFAVHNEVYAAVACGVITGLGAGMVLRSLGSNGGLDVLGVYLYQRWNIGLGKTFFVFNAVLFSMGFFRLSPDLVIASLIMAFVSSASMENILALFNQRKVVFIISDLSDDIGQAILSSLRQSATFLRGVGAYSRKDKNVLMTVVNNLQLKKLEEIVFSTDPQALFIVENTFSVLGASFSRRKVY